MAQPEVLDTASRKVLRSPQHWRPRILSRFTLIARTMRGDHSRRLTRVKIRPPADPVWHCC